MQQSTGALARLLMQVTLAILQIILVFTIYQIINFFILFVLFPAYESILTFPAMEEIAIQTWIMIETLQLASIATILFGVGHAIWRILDNIISWRIAERQSKFSN